MNSTIDAHADRGNDPRSTEELIRLALTEEDEDDAWQPVMVLHYRATREVLLRANELCASGIAKERKLGADLLGQLGVPNRTYPEECFQILARTLASENDAGTLDALAVALGHLREPRAVPLLLPLIHHVDCDVRFGVVHGLTGQEDPSAIRGLIQLSSDEDDDVRDWATFGLGSMLHADTPEIREALLARLSDANADVRGEALVGLAQRKDLRVLIPLIEELHADSVGMLALEAAELLGNPRLGPSLLELKGAWTDDEDRHTKLLHRALLTCLPARRV